MCMSGKHHVWLLHSTQSYKISLDIENIQPRSQVPPSFLLLAVLIVMKSWAGPVNEARKHPLHACRLELKFHILKEIKDIIYTCTLTSSCN